jgi:hypothetical protein
VRYWYNNPDNLHKDQDMARVDYAISSRVNSFFRWINDYQSESVANGIWTGEPFPMQPQHRPKPGSSWSWNIVGTFTPTLVSETILTFNHQSQSLSISGTNPLNRDTLGANWQQIYPATNITNSVQDVSTGAGVNFSLGDPGWHNWGKDWGVTENLTWTKGHHNIKFGIFLNKDDKAQTGNWGLEGNINFSPSTSMAMDTGNGLANLMLGNFNNFTQASAAVYPYFRFLEGDFYVQDNWKVSKRLTIDLGVRVPYMVPTYTVVRGGTLGGEGTWTLYSVDTSKYDVTQRPQINPTTGFLIGNPIQVLSPLGLVCDPCAGTPRGFSPAKAFVEPRVGAAYDVFGDGSTAVRGGFGVFNERLRQNNFSFGAGAAWPNLSSGSVYNGNVSSIDVSSVAGANAPIQPPNHLAIGQHDAYDLQLVWRRAAAIALEVRAGRFLLRQPLDPPDGSASGQRVAGGLPPVQPQRPSLGWRLGQLAPAVHRLGPVDGGRNAGLRQVQRDDDPAEPAVLR